MILTIDKPWLLMFWGVFCSSSCADFDHSSYLLLATGNENCDIFQAKSVRGPVNQYQYPEPYEKGQR